MRTRLATYNEARHGNSQIELLVNVNQLDKDLCLSLSVETNEFVTTTMKQLLNCDVFGSREFIDMAKKWMNVLWRHEILLNCCGGL